MGSPLPLLPQTLGLPSPGWGLQALLGWKQPEPWGSEARCRSYSSSQSPHSVSSLQGKAESQGPSVCPRPWSNDEVLPV